MKIFYILVILLYHSYLILISFVGLVYNILVVHKYTS